MGAKFGLNVHDGIAPLDRADHSSEARGSRLDRTTEDGLEALAYLGQPLRVGEEI